jgi:hypothetical protein
MTIGTYVCKFTGKDAMEKLAVPLIVDNTITGIVKQ